MKVCHECKQNLSLDLFHKRTQNADGLANKCKQCRSIENKIYRKNNEKIIKEKKRKYYLKNKDKINSQIRDNYYKNKESRLARIANWKKQNKNKVNLGCAKRRAAKLNRNIYLNDEYNLFVLEEAYSFATLKSELTGVKHHVDHIVPLLGKTVSGLHVADNIQVIPAIENCSKRADYWPDMWN